MSIKDMSQELNVDFLKEKADRIKDSDIEKVIKKSGEIIDKTSKEEFKEYKERITLYLELIKAYKEGRYKDIQTEQVKLITAALLYIVSPFDLIPDFIPGVGLSDDIMIIKTCIELTAKDLEKFKSTL